MTNFPVDEIKRKTFHILTLLYVVAYWYLPLNFVLSTLFIIIIFVLIAEIVRTKNEKFNVFILKTLGGTQRESEVNKISGLPWTLSGAFLTMFLFNDKTIVLASFLYLAFGDAIAALIGKAYGRHKIYAGKTFEGSLACFIVCFIIGMIILPTWQFAFIGALIATLIETIPWPLNDNFWMQIINAGILTLLSGIL
ncbi:phosphatidate cytidylyltransferase [Elusimicrobiota bacterium]